MFRISCLLVAAMLAVAIAGADDAQPKAALDAVQGVWKLEEVVIDGETQALPPKPPRWLIRGDKVLYAGKPLAALVIDPGTTPRSIDLGFLKPKRTYEGVYSLEDDTLKICVNRITDGVKERPLSFATKGKANLRLFVFKRLKEAGADGIEHLGGFAGIAIGYNKQKELVIRDVLDGTPAQKAGLKKDDVVLKVDGREVTELRPTVAMVAQSRPGSELTVRVRRAGKEQDIKVKVGVVPFFLLD
jgi:uncharacterized protein (TIGR03067 family)